MKGHWEKISSDVNVALKEVEGRNHQNLIYMLLDLTGFFFAHVPSYLT